MRFSEFNEGWKDMWSGSPEEKKQDQRDKDAYLAMRLDKETAKFEKQGLSPEDARKYAYRKVHGSPKTEAEIKVTKVMGNKIEAGDGVEIDLDKVDVETDPKTKTVAIKPKGTAANKQDPRSMIKPGGTISIGV